MTLKDIKNREKVVEGLRKYLSGLVEGSREHSKFMAMVKQIQYDIDIAKSRLNKEELEMLRKMK